MNILAFETSTESCSAALMIGDACIARSELAPRRHAERLLPMCEELLAEAGLSRRDLDVIAVGRGPGAFTGVRLGISVAQGMALALDIPVIPVSTLAALACDAPENGTSILALIDARMGEVYAGTFQRVASGLVEALDIESVGAASALSFSAAVPWNIIGSGWDTYRELIIDRLGCEPFWAAGQYYPQATAVARLAAPLARAGRGVSPELALPVYLRDKVALTLSEQRAAK